MKARLYRVAVLVAAGVLFLALPAASQEDRPEDEAPTADDDGGSEAGGGGDVTTDGEQIDDFVNVNNPDGNGLTRVNLNSESACCTDAWRLVNNSDAGNRFELREGTSTLRMVMEQGSGDLGLGTDNPSQRLHIEDSGGFQINLDDGTNEYIQDAFGSSFRIGHTNTRRQFRIFGDDAPNDALVVRDGIGIGTTEPQTALDIHNVAGQSLTQYRLVNEDESWINGVNTAGRFILSKGGTGGFELFFRERNHSVGTVDVEGPVRATAFNTSSSKKFKTDAQDVNSNDVLSKLNQLPVKSWQFKACKEGEGRLPHEDGTQPPPCSGEGQGPRHIGPMAEDFHALFGLGDGESISTLDADGVMMSAIQALTQQLEEKEQTIAELRQQGEARDEAIAELQSRLEALEAQGEPSRPRTPGRR